MTCCSTVVNDPDIQTSEFGYLLISQLVGMKDRVLAKKIEFDIWGDSFKPRPFRLLDYINAMKESEDDGEFETMAAEIVKRSDIDFHVSENGEVTAKIKID